MASTRTSTITFQPWQRESSNESSLKGMLGRVNLERGHFKDINEASLQEEIAGEGALVLSESEDDDEDEDDFEEPDDTNSKPKNREELFKAKYEMLAHVKAAEQEVLMALDFISLVMSKDNPKQGQATMSQYLKENVPSGSLGMDMWQRMQTDTAREAQDQLLSTNVRLESLQQSADDLLTAANRLQDTVEKETRYWNEVLSVSEQGWNVCRIPGQRHRLGVRFGFSESAPEFSQRGIAALNPTAEGHVALDRGVGSKPKGLRVVLRKDGATVGTSKLPDQPNSDETTLAARIRYARDSLYDEELYHEMVRESRTLASLGVVTTGSAIQFGSSSRAYAGVQVSLDLIALDENYDLHTVVSQEEDSLAEAVVLAARLLLSQAHRDRLRKRSEIPAPLSDKRNDEKPLLPIIRPIMSFLMHHSALDQLNAYLETSARVLRAAQIMIEVTKAQFSLTNASITDTESLVSALMQPWISETQFKVKGPNDDHDIAIRLGIETTLARSFGSVFLLFDSSQTKPYRFESLDALVAAADANIASSLAKALSVSMAEGWTCNERGAEIVKPTGIDKEHWSIWVKVDSKASTLSLYSQTQSRVWKADEDSVKQGFWNAIDGVVPKLI